MLSQKDRKEIRAQVRGLLRDLSSLDGERALRRYTPARRDKGNPERFLEVIGQGFPQLLRTWSAEFGEPYVTGSHTAQPVRVVAWDGAPLRAVYLLRRENGRWLVDGCVARPQGGVRWPN